MKIKIKIIQESGAPNIKQTCDNFEYKKVKTSNFGGT